MSVRKAEKAVRGWLKADVQPLGTALGQQIMSVETFSDDDGQTIYYVVYLQPSGFVIVPGDDRVEPIICFAPVGRYDPSDDNPLGALVSRDVPGRIAAVRALQAAADTTTQKKDRNNKETALQKASLKAQSKWSDLQRYDNMVGTLGMSGISEVWVAPFVLSTWDQTTVDNISPEYGGISCYNYYTPPFTTPNGDPYNYPIGCVAAAMSQLMRFHQYPTAGVGPLWFQIEVDGGAPQWQSLRGGDGAGGPYVWSAMVLQPDNGITDPQRQAIGALCFDAGVSIEMSYRSSGSSASLMDAVLQLEDTFNYSNAIYGWNNNNNIGAGLNGMVNPNLDAGCPVAFSVRRAYGGHVLICDGYGYNASTLYHHLNMGWSGSYNAWYNLPYIDAYYTYDTVDGCAYNVFTSGSGEIISGRITDPEGLPISGASVTATGSGTYHATSNAEGIYALAKVPSSRTYTISVTKGKWNFTNRVVTNGTSVQDSTTCGNRWGIDFSGTISAGFVELDKDAYAAPETIAVRLVDSDLQGGGSHDVVLMVCGGDKETVTLTENPPGTRVFKGSIATAAGSAIVEDGTIQVLGSKMIIGVYEDADDGTGSPATARDTATVVAGSTVFYQTDFTDPPDGWYVMDGGSSADSWSLTTEWGDRTSPYWTGTFVIADSDWAGYGVVMDEDLVTCGIDCSAYRNVTLKFNHYFKYSLYNWDEICDVDVRVDGGDWENIARYEGQNAEGLVELPLSPFGADGDPNVQIRWHYYNALWEYWWGIDDVQITGVLTDEGIPGDFEPDCDVDFYDFGIFASAWLSGPSDGNWNPDCDIYETAGPVIDIQDLAVFVENWLMIVE